MTDALAGIAILTGLRCRKTFRGNADLDRRDEERVSDLHHALRVESPETNRHRRNLTPYRIARQRDHPRGDDRSTVRGRWALRPQCNRGEKGRDKAAQRAHGQHRGIEYRCEG